MSYHTSYQLQIIEGDPFTIDDLREVSEGASYALTKDGETSESCSWYDHEIDLKSFSRKFPATVFKLSGQGEDNEDMWVKYFMNGKMQECKAEITYPPFDKNKLQ